MRVPVFRLVILLTAFTALAACSGDSPMQPTTTVPDPDPSGATVGLFLKDNDPETLQRVLTDYAFTLVEVYGEGRFALVAGDFDPTELRADDRVLAFQRDAWTGVSSPVELTMSFYEGDFDQQLPVQDALARWNLDQVHAVSTGAGVKIAVLDTGVDPDHPLLQGRVTLIEEGGRSLGSVERVTGRDSDGDGRPDEAYGHGTHVAGTIALVAPAAEILAVRVLDSDGVGTAFDLARGLYRAMEWGADIVNLSLVLSGESDAIDDVIDDLSDRGILVVGAAGNEPGEAFFPASESGVLSVAALSADLRLAGFSASKGVRVAAPGVGVISAFPGGRWAAATGTSMAGASASGAVATLISMTGSSPSALEAIRQTALELDPVDDGAISLWDAVRFVAASSGGED